MGFGLIGAGAAVSGLMDGYQKGRKFAQDEERFEMEKDAAKQAKELRGLQIRRAQGELDDDDMERQIRSEGDKIRKDYEDRVKAFQSQAAQVPAQAAGVVTPQPAGLTAPQPAAPQSAPITENDAAQFGIENPAAAAAQANVPAQKPGVADPAAQASAAPAQPPVQSGQQAPSQPKTIFDLQREMHVALLNNQMRSKKADVPALMKQVFDSARFYKMAETQATLDIMNSFEAGESQDRLFARMAEMGKPAPAGTTMVKTTKPLFDGSTIMVPDVEIRMPDGRVVSRSQLARSTMTAEEIMRADTQIAQVAGQVAHHKAVEKIQSEEAARRATADTRRHEEVMQKMKEAALVHQQTYQLNFDKFQWDQWERRQRMATAEFERSYGFTPLTQADRAKIEKEFGEDALKKAEERQVGLSNKVVGAMVMYNANIDPRTLRPNASAAEVIKAMEAMAKVDTASLKRDQIGRPYIEIGGNKVLVPMPQAASSEPKPPPPGRAEAAGAADPARPGISRPSGGLPEYIPGAKSMNEQVARERGLEAARASQREADKARQERERLQREAQAARNQMSRTPVGTYPGSQ